MEQVPSGWIPSTEYWYGPSRRWTWATDRARQEQADPTPLPKFLEEPVKVATTDPTGVKQTAMKIRGGILYVTPEPYKDDVTDGHIQQVWGWLSLEDFFSGVYLVGVLIGPTKEKEV